MLGSVTAGARLSSPSCATPASSSARSPAPTIAGSARAGLRTMAVRLKQHEASALADRALARRRGPRSRRVLHPALPELPRPRIFRRATSRARRACSPSRSKGGDEAGARRVDRRAASCSASAIAGAGSKASRCRSIPSAHRGVARRMRRAAGAAADRARGSRRPDRRSRPGVRRVPGGARMNGAIAWLQGAGPRRPAGQRGDRDRASSRR